MATNGEGSSRCAAIANVSTLHHAMREPSTRPPEVVVLDQVPESPGNQDTLNPKEDLWLSTVDGRFNSPIVSIHVGVLPAQQTFFVHKDILTKIEWFQKALCGVFRESKILEVELPDEDPAIFHFLITFLYEDRYCPLRTAASALDPAPEKGKAKETTTRLAPEPVTTNADAMRVYQLGPAALNAMQNTHIPNNLNNRARRGDRRRLRQLQERAREKHPGQHRPDCHCPQCIAQMEGPPCWHCGAPRSSFQFHNPANVLPPPPRYPPHPRGGNLDHALVDELLYGNLPPDDGEQEDDAQAGQNARETANSTTTANANGSRQRGDEGANPRGSGMENDRIRGEDMRTWLLAYRLNMDVYICANKFLMDDFKREIRRVTVDLLETAGTDAAQADVLLWCLDLYQGLNESDPLLKMVFARVGFLQPLFWRRFPEETAQFLLSNPEISAALLRETTSRHEQETLSFNLPPMEQEFMPSTFVSNLPQWDPRVHHW